MAARDPGRTPARRHRARAADRTPRTRDRLPRRFRRGGGTTGRGGGRADAGRAAGYPGRAAGGGGRPVRQPAGAARPVQGHLHHRRRRPRDGSRVARALRSGRYRALAGDVVEMVHRIVDEVAGEGLHGEAGSVAAAAGALPLGAGHALEPGGDGGRRLVQRRGDLGGVLLGVAVGDGGLVLVPVREQRVVLAEHQLEPPVVQPEYVADVAGVLQRRPRTRFRAGAGIVRAVGSGQRLRPRRRVRHDHAGHGCDGKALGVEAALRAGPLQDPGPVLGVRNDRHARMLLAHRVGPMGSEIAPFRIEVPEAELADLRRRLRQTRWPEAELVADWSQGVPLDYLRYGAAGSDWGTSVSTILGQRDRAHVAGIHLVPPLAGPDPATFGDLTPGERAALDSLRVSAEWDAGYSTEHATRPQTIGYGLVDSPAALCAWIIEKFWSWTDHDGSLDAVLSRDDLLDNLMLYWLPGADATVNVPAGCSVFPKELQRPSRRWAQRRFTDIRYWGEPPRGGHFAAFEQPALFADEARAFFR